MLVHASHGLVLAVWIAVGGVRAVDASLEEAARNIGASAVDVLSHGDAAARRARPHRQRDLRVPRIARRIHRHVLRRRARRDDAAAADVQRQHGRQLPDRVDHRAAAAGAVDRLHAAWSSASSRPTCWRWWGGSVGRRQVRRLRWCECTTDCSAYSERVASICERFVGARRSGAAFQATRSSTSNRAERPCWRSSSSVLRWLRLPVGDDGFAATSTRCGSFRVRTAWRLCAALACPRVHLRSGLALRVRTRARHFLLRGFVPRTCPLMGISMRFEDLNLVPPLLQALAACGYAEPAPIQAQTIPVLLDGRDVIASAQTGTARRSTVLRRASAATPGNGRSPCRSAR